MSQNKLYNKGSSILDIRGISSQRLELLKRIKTLDLDSLSVSDSDPVRLALDDLKDDFSSHSSELGRFFLREHVVEEMSRLSDDELPRYLRYRYAYEIYPVKKIVSEYPPVVQIEPTSICNYRCVFCYQCDDRLSDKRNGHMGVMDIGLFKEIIDELSGKVEGITLASRGEPTVNKSFSAMLGYMGGKFLAGKINTNASLLDEDLCHAILSADLQTLVFSADAAADPLYSTLRVGGNLDKVVRNVERFNEIRERHYPDSRLITRVSGVRYNDQQNMDDMMGFWKRFVDQVAFVDYNPWENVYDAEKKGVDKPCSDLWRRLFVWWDGRVCPCDVDYLTTLLDDRYPEHSISDIWNGQTYLALRESHLSNKRQSIEPCSRCVVI